MTYVVKSSFPTSFSLPFSPHVTAANVRSMPPFCDLRMVRRTNANRSTGTNETPTSSETRRDPFLPRIAASLGGPRRTTYGTDDAAAISDVPPAANPQATMASPTRAPSEAREDPYSPSVSPIHPFDTDAATPRPRTSAEVESIVIQDSSDEEAPEPAKQATPTNEPGSRYAPGEEETLRAYAEYVPNVRPGVLGSCAMPGPPFDGLLVADSGSYVRTATELVGEEDETSEGL